MPEHENPGPATGTEVADETGPAPVSADQPALPAEGDVPTRLERVERTLDDLARRLESGTDEQRRQIAELTRGTLGALKRLAGAFGAARVEIEERVESLLERRLSAIPVEMTDAMGARVRSSMEGVDDRTAGAIDGLRSSIAGLEERLTGALGGVSEATQARLSATVDEIASVIRQLEGRIDAAAGREDLQSLRSELDAVAQASDRVGATSTSILEGLNALRGLPSQITESMAEVERAADDAAGVQEDLDERLKLLADSLADRMSALETRLGETLSKTVAALAEDRSRLAPQLTDVAHAANALRSEAKESAVALREEIAGLRMEAAARAETLQAALGRIDRLTATLESMGSRRGFRDLMDAEERLREQQSAYADRLIASGQVISQNIQALEQRLTEVADQVAEAAGDQIAATLEEFREEVAKVPVRKLSPAELKEVVALQKELETVTGGLRSDLADLRKRIESWGRPRSAPRLAEEIGAVEGRVRDVERTLQADLVEAVMTRLQRLFDRRFEALVQLVDARVREIAEAITYEERGRRGGGGLFRRSSE